MTPGGFPWKRRTLATRDEVVEEDMVIFCSSYYRSVKFQRFSPMLKCDSRQKSMSA